jgi:hypothetical protein
MRLPDQKASSDVLISYAIYTSVKLSAKKEAEGYFKKFTLKKK